MYAYFIQVSFLFSLNSALKKFKRFFFVSRLSIPQDKRIPLTDRDKSKARDLLERPYIKSQEAWVQEVFCVTYCSMIETCSKRLVLSVSVAMQSINSRASGNCPLYTSD